MARDLPALDLLKGFEAAARHLSFTKAGEELFLTQSAISRQVQALEEQLGIKLFHRRTRALLLTDEGQRYYKAVRGALDGLRAATASVRASRATATLTVSTTVTFASLWLVPKLAGFQSAQPGVQVRLVAETGCRTSSAKASTSRSATARPRWPGRARSSSSASGCSRS